MELGEVALAEDAAAAGRFCSIMVLAMSRTELAKASKSWKAWDSLAGSSGFGVLAEMALSDRANATRSLVKADDIDHLRGHRVF